MKTIVRENLHKYMAANLEVNSKGEVADKMGVNRSDFSAFFTGLRIVPDATLNRIAKFFDIKFDAVKNEHLFYVNKRVSQWEGSSESEKN